MGLRPTKGDEDADVAQALLACRAETRLGVRRTSTRVSMQHASVRAPRRCLHLTVQYSHDSW